LSAVRWRVHPSLGGASSVPRFGVEAANLGCWPPDPGFLQICIENESHYHYGAHTSSMTHENSASPFGIAVTCDHCGGSALALEGGLVRCLCGSLLARYVDRGLELKCRRCKRTVTVALRATEQRIT
jgi:hypothetical protein